MITEKMIKAGIEAYVANILPYGCIGRADKMVTAIYQAMADQKQKDALIAYHDAVKDNEAIINSIGHSSR